MRLTVLMYHYVRDTRRSRYPALKAMDATLFREQLAYVRRHYTVLAPDDVLEVVLDGATAPSRPALLTFDDGYRDHLEHVIPELRAGRLKGLFFPVAETAYGRAVLPANKIHHILAAADSRRVYHDLIDILAGEPDILPLSAYQAEFLVANRLGDEPEVNFVKRMLQKALPEPVRRRIVDMLFARYVTADERAFAAELYLSRDELRELRREGMSIGNHTRRHDWLGVLSRESQESEIVGGLDLLADLGVPLDNWFMCYPYGSYNDTTLEILRRERCGIGFTTRFDLADPANDDPLRLPRLDVFHLPTDGAAPANEWTLKAAS